jgi:hypothetical protein
MASVTARKKIVKEAGSPVDELEEQVAQVCFDWRRLGCLNCAMEQLDDEFINRQP